MGPTTGSSSQLVGNGFDDVATETTTTVGQSVGTFPAISGMTGETGGFNCFGGSGTADCYSLQLNSNTFVGTSSFFTGSATAWEQFVYSNSFQQLFIQYWLINYISGTRTSCPSTPPPGGSGWFLYYPHCYANSPVMIVPGGRIPATNLGKLTLSGFANRAGSPGNDIVQLCISGGSCYSVTLTDGIVNLYQHWTQSEFNVFGDGGGSEANFNLGTSIQVSTALMGESGSAIASSCAHNGTTGETNNLFLQGCEASPSISSGISFVECVGSSGQSTCSSPFIKTSLGTSLSSSSIPAGGSVTDKATLSGGIAPTGTIAFFYSTSNSCPTTGATQIGTPVTLSDNGAYTSASQTFPTPGTYYVYAVYSGDGTNNGATSACEPLVVGSTAPALGTVLSANAIAVGGSASDTATLSGGSSPTGTITFFESTTNTCPASGATQVGTPVTVTGDGSYPSTSATFSTAGTYYWYATYSGDSNNNAVTSQCEPLSVASSSDLTSTGVTPNPASATIGASATFTATVTDDGLSPTTPTGTATWSDGGAGGTFTPATCTLTTASSSSGSCQAAYKPASKAGPVTITASYPGDSSHGTSSGTSALTVNTRATSTGVSPSTTTVNAGSVTTLTATVKDTDVGTVTVPTGTISWSDGGAGGTFSSGGVCTLTSAVTCKLTYTAPSAAGPVTITASYSGDPTHSVSSGTSSLTVLRVTTTAVSPNRVSAIMRDFSPITYTATVTDTSHGTASAPSGTVSWSDGGKGGTFSSTTCTLASAGPASSKCTMTYTPSASASSGSIKITAAYAGDSSHVKSSGSATITVNKRTTSAAISPSSASVGVGTPTTFTVTVTDKSPGTPQAPTGTVTWTASVSGGSFTSTTCKLIAISATQSQCSVTYTSPSTAGTLTIIAKYGGDSSHIVSSGTSKLTVT
jgi:Bacterial Ig-like domain (group 3)